MKHPVLITLFLLAVCGSCGEAGDGANGSNRIHNAQGGQKSSFYPIGIYGTNGITNPFPTVSAQGFNTVIVPPDGKIIQQLQDANLNALVKFPMTEAASGPESTFNQQISNLKAQVAALKGYSSIVAWYVFDEPDDHEIPLERIGAVISAVKEVDPSNNIFAVLSRPDLWKSYLSYFDIIGIDPYLKNTVPGQRVYENTEKVGAWIAQIRNDLSDIDEAFKALWVVIQSFEYHYQDPSLISPYKEPLLVTDVDAMIHQVTGNNADGILFYTLYLKGGINAQTQKPFNTFLLINDRPDLWNFMSGIDKRISEYRSH